MTDEEVTLGIDQADVNNTSEVENAQDDSSSTEAATEEVSEATPEIKTEEAEPTETGDSSKGANQRIRELNAKAKAAEQKAQSLAQRLEELSKVSDNTLPPYNPVIEPGTEISPEQYRQDVGRQADAIVTLRLKQQETLNKIKSESLDAVRAYPELDPESEVFDKDLSDTVTEAVEAYVKVDPYNASVGKFVDRLMKPYQRAVTKEVGQVSEKLAKQVSETALRPTSIRQAEKPVNEKTIAELEAELGIVNG